MDYNIENKGFVCFVYNLQRRRAFWAALLAVLAVKFILCELFLGGAVADALVAYGPARPSCPRDPPSRSADPEAAPEAAPDNALLRPYPPESGELEPQGRVSAKDARSEGTEEQPQESRPGCGSHAAPPPDRRPSD